MARWDGRHTWDAPPSATGAPARLRVATCQMPVTHDLHGNLAHALDLIRRAKAAGADAAHLPECALSGYGPASWPDRTGFDWDALDEAVTAVRACEPWVVAGSVHRDGARARPDEAGFVVDAPADDPGQDRFFDMVRAFRRSATDGSLHASHLPGASPLRPERQEPASRRCLQGSLFGFSDRHPPAPAAPPPSASHGQGPW